MKVNRLGKTGWNVSEIGLGTWQVGGRWGQEFDDELADRILDTAVSSGMTFVDTADVYSGGSSERAVGRALGRHPGRFRVATKCGRQIQPHVDAQYTPARLRGFVEESLRRLNVETIDLIQLHCPPTPVYERPEIFATFDELKKEGKIRHLGVSVEKVDEALRAIEYDNVATVQIIFNVFRLKPAELFFERARRKDVGVVVRVPLASGLLTGRFTAETQFSKDDHRSFNRDGAAFDKGETFSGVDYDTALEAVEELKALLPSGVDLAAWALRWILDFEAVSTVIPGASDPSQILRNVRASELPPVTKEAKLKIRDIYDRLIRASVHSQW